MSGLFANADGGAGDAVLDLEALGDDPTFAVLGLQPQGVDEDVAAGLTDALVVELSTFEGVRVYSRRDIETMMAMEQERQLLGCDDISCMVEIGGALGARFIVTGSASRLDQSHAVNVRIVDTQSADVVATDREAIKGSPDELLVGMRFLVRRMLGHPLAGMGACARVFLTTGRS